MKKDFKRVNLLIRSDQHDRVLEEGLSLSGLVRDLLDDHFSDSTIVLSVSAETRRLYNYVVSNFGAGDLELEAYILRALDEFLEHRQSEIQNLRAELGAKKDKL